MADGSKIEWTEATWNPLRGCTRVSPGCGGPGPHGGCYAEGIAARFSDPGQAYHGLAKRTAQGGRWTGEVMLVEHLLAMPLRWRRPRRIFVNSMSDLFHEKVPDDWIDRIFAVMALCPQHTFQVLTKRSARMRAYLSRPGVEVRIGIEAFGLVLDAMAADRKSTLGEGVMAKASDINPGGLVAWPLPNVWLGVSVEDQQRAGERIPDLLAAPAAVRWLSCEPLLGPVDLEQIELPRGEALNALTGDRLELNGGQPYQTFGDQIAWVVAGGESGPKARPMHPDWARDLRDQCEAAGVPFFFKQWGEFAPGEIAGDFLDPERKAKGMAYFDGRWAEEWSLSDGHADDEPDVYRIGKKRAGRTLDGQLHDQFPEAAHA